MTMTPLSFAQIDIAGWRMEVCASPRDFLHTVIFSAGKVFGNQKSRFKF